MTDHRDSPPGVAAIGRLLQLCVYAPIGAGVKLIDDAPAALGRARMELSNARFIGRMVVSQGEARLRESLERDGRSEADTASVPATSDGGVSAMETDADPAPEVRTCADIDAAEPAATESADELAIPDYDHLPAIDIIGQLDALSAAERDEIDAYERSHRRRRTVLGRIEQLRSGS